METCLVDACFQITVNPVRPPRPLFFWSQFAPSFSSETHSEIVIAQTYVHLLHIAKNKRGLAAYFSYQRPAVPPKKSEKNSF